MLCVLALTILAAANGAVMEKRALQTMDPYSLQAFTRLFRQFLLDKVALELNNTVDLSKALKIKVDQCKPKIDAKVTECKSCAKSACQADPSFTDYLNIANPYTYLKGPLDDISGKFGDVVDLLGDGASGFMNSLKDLGASATGGVYDGFSSAYNEIASGLNAVKDTFLDAGSSVIDTAGLIGDGLTDIGSSIGGGLTDAGSALEHAGSSIGNAIGSIFGRKREIDPDTRRCMEKCESCKPLLMPTQDQMITAVCGEEIVKTNNTIQAHVKKIQAVYNYALDKNTPIIRELQIDPTSINAMTQLTNVHITVHLNGHYVSYKTQVPYSLLNLPDTARRMAMEFWGKFN